MGRDPLDFLDTTPEEYLIRIAMLRKAIELRDTNQEYLADMIGVKIAQLMGLL